MKQTTLGSTDWALKSKVTRRAQFLNEMEAVVPWPRLLAVIEPHIAAPPSTKNAARQRDPEMKQVRKGKQWHFGMKLHIGTDRRGLVHGVVSGPAAQGDISGWTNCCVDKSGRFSVTRRTGRKITGGIAATRALPIDAAPSMLLWFVAGGIGAWAVLLAYQRYLIPVELLLGFTAWMLLG